MTATDKRHSTPPRSIKGDFTVEVELPMVPNFIKVGALTLPVSQIQRKVLRKIGTAWVAALVKKGRRGT